MSSSERLTFVDVAKGIGILLVALAHNDLAAYAPFAFHWIYSFHMPFFFLLSGLFFKPGGSLWALLQKRSTSLLRPYFFGIFLIYFWAIFFDTMGLPTAFGRIVKALYGNGYYLDWVAMWFLPALFMVNLFAFGFYAVFGRFSTLWRGAALLGFLAFGVWMLPWFNPLTLPGIGTFNGLPWSLDLALLAGFFFVSGRELFALLPQTWFGSPWVLLWAAALNLGLVFAFPQTMDFNIRAYSLPLVFTLEALSGSIFVLAISWWLARAGGWLAAGFSYLGRISVLILIFHNPVQSYLTGKIDFLLGGSVYSPLLVFPFSIAIPALIYELGVRQNPVAARWFGMRG